MAFPTTPTDGQQATINGISYTYNSTKGAWKRTTAYVDADTIVNSYNTANTGLGTATASFIAANNAWTAANNAVDTWVRSAANAASTYANAAFGMANAAFAKANTGGGGGGGTGITYTASNTVPTGNTVGDQWFNVDENILYEYINDGTSSVWVDMSSSPLQQANGPTSGASTSVSTGGASNARSTINAMIFGG